MQHWRGEGDYRKNSEGRGWDQWMGLDWIGLNWTEFGGGKGGWEGDREGERDITY